MGTARAHIRYFLIMAVVAICAALVVAVLLYDRVQQPEQVLQDVVMQADVTLHELNYTESENGLARWNLVADSAAHDVAEETTAIGNVRLKLFNQEQFGDVELTANTGTINMTTRQVHAKGDVIITTQNGYRFTTDSVDFAGNSTENGVITTDEEVHITSAGFSITGTGLVGDIAGGTFVLKKNVTAVYYPQAVKGGM
ncbi:MAG: LPS export ABC transporter periplasmic protein LptC [Desulfobacteraceae bacterium 4572_35.1]|nr:MAG: LPS export ABC transporter periplasmic protein LptC [Desulfobacteraceae bacterium 4572_35.1]